MKNTIDAHPRRESQVRHMVWSDQGVWVSIRLDSTLRLFHARTMQHLQYLDIEPFITRMLGSTNLGFSLIRISSLMISSKRLWIGTGNGVVVSVPVYGSKSERFEIEGEKPLKLLFYIAWVGSTPLTVEASPDTKNSTTLPGSVVRMNADDLLVPYCYANDAQFSFHGHRDAVKFFVNVPGKVLWIWKKIVLTKKINNNMENLTQVKQLQNHKRNSSILNRSVKRTYS